MDIFDSGGDYEAPSANAEEPIPAQASDEGAVQEPSVQVEPEQGIETPEAPTVETPEVIPPTEDEIAKMEQEAEQALADEKTPKWFKNVFENVYKPRITELTEKLGTYEPLSEFGSVEEIGQKLAFANSLETVRTNPQTGMPELTTEPFVKSVYDKDPKVAYQLINDLANLPSPVTQGWTVLQEILKGSGVDPSRLEDIKTFAANGYQLQQGQYPPPDAEELALIPENLRPTFASLSPDQRDEYLAMSESARDAALENARIAIETKTRESTEKATSEQREAAERQRQEQEFAQEINQKGQEYFIKSGDTVFNTFVESLAKHVSKADAFGIANTVLNSFEPTVQGQRSLEFLKSEGITVDPTIPQTLTQLEEVGRHIAYYEKIGDRSSMEKAVARSVELQEKLIAKGNKITAEYALKKAKAQTAPLQAQNNALAANLNSRHAAAGVGSTVSSANNVTYDFDDSAYLEDLRSTGFGSRR